MRVSPTRQRECERMSVSAPVLHTVARECGFKSTEEAAGRGGVLAPKSFACKSRDFGCSIAALTIDHAVGRRCPPYKQYEAHPLLLFGGRESHVAATAQVKADPAGVMRA